MAIENGIPLITDLKCAKLFIEALRRVGGEPKLNPRVDCLTSHRIVRLPGLVDVHVHMREPGATHKETFHTGTWYKRSLILSYYSLISSRLVAKHFYTRNFLYNEVFRERYVFQARVQHWQVASRWCCVCQIRPLLL